MASFNEVTRAIGKRRVVERLPYTGAGIDALGAQVAALLKTEGDAQRIILDVTKPHIHLEKFVSGQVDQDAEQEVFNTLLGSVPMHEFVPEHKMTPYETLWHMFKHVTDEELEVVLVFVGNMVALSKWIPAISKKEPRIFGVKVKRLKQVPDDLIIVCGAVWQAAEPEDIRYTVKGLMA